jgi:5'-nucleotidase
LLAATASAGAADKELVTVTILHTNDIHGHVTGWQGWAGELAGKKVGGFDRIASVVERVRAETPNVLLLDAGDTLGDSMPADLTKGRAILSLMNAVGYDAMVIGNHEPDFTMENLREWIAAARFPVVAANVVERGSGNLFRFS